MTLEKIIDVADQAFPDGFVRKYYDDPQTEHGDSMARFIAFNIIETYEEDITDEEQLAAAMHCLLNGRDELIAVIEALAKAAA